MKKIKQFKAEIYFHLLLNLCIAGFISLSPYVYIPFGNIKVGLIYFFHFLMLQLTIFGFVYLLSLSKKAFTIIFPLLFVLLSAIAFWIYTQDISVNFGLIQAVIESNLDIAVDVFSIPFFIYVSLALVLALFIIKKHRKHPLCI